MSLLSCHYAKKSLTMLLSPCLCVHIKILSSRWWITCNRLCDLRRWHFRFMFHSVTRGNLCSNSVGSIASDFCWSKKRLAVTMHLYYNLGLTSFVRRLFHFEHFFFECNHASNLLKKIFHTQRLQNRYKFKKIRKISWI